MKDTEIRVRPDPSDAPVQKLEPEERLFRAILAQAITDIRSKEHRASVLHWMTTEWFETVCEYADRNPDTVRKRLQALAPKARRVASEKQREMDVRTKQIRTLRQQGMPVQTITETVGISRTLVHRALKQGIEKCNIL